MFILSPIKNIILILVFAIYCAFRTFASLPISSSFLLVALIIICFIEMGLLQAIESHFYLYFTTYREQIPPWCSGYQCLSPMMRTAYNGYNGHGWK